MSTTLKELTADELAELANRYTGISTKLFEFRVTRGLTGDDEHLVRVELEQKLDALANILRGRAIALVVTDTGLKAEDLHAALDHARRTLDKLDKVREVIGIATLVIALGGAIVSGNAKAIVKALKAFRDTDEEEDDGEEGATA